MESINYQVNHSSPTCTLLDPLHVCTQPMFSDRTLPKGDV